MKTFYESSQRVFFILATLVLSSCGGNSGSSTRTTPATEGEAAFQKAQTAIGGVGEILVPSAINVAIQSALGSKSITFETCSDINPVNAANIGDDIACKLTKNSGSPDTAFGALHMANQIVKTIESSVTLAYEADGSQYDNLDFSVLMNENGTATTFAGVLSAVATDVSGVGSSWQKRLDVCLHTMNNDSMQTMQNCQDTTFSLSIFFDLEDKVAFKTVVRFSGTYEVTSFHMNSTSLRFESWDLANGNHTRMVVEGTFSENFELESITSGHVGSAYSDGNWGGYNSTYDGANLCMRYEGTGGLSDGNYTMDTCGAYPTYDVAFHTPPAAGAPLVAFQAFADANDKGKLSFANTAGGFAIGSYYIDN